MKKILVFRNDRFGEFLLNIPAIRALKETFNAEITVVVDDYVKDLAEYIDEIDKVIYWENCRHSYIEMFKFSRKLKKEKFDIAVILNPTKEAHLVSFLANIPVRVGYNRKWGVLLTNKKEDTKNLGNKHEVEYNLEVVNLIGADTDDVSLNINIPHRVMKDIKNFLESNGFTARGFITVHPFASDEGKLWPLEKYYKIIDFLKEDKNIIIIGGKENIETSKYFNSLLTDENVINLVGKTDLVQLAAILNKSELLISNDSGPVHLSCCVNTPVIVLFSNSQKNKSPKRWSPWGDKCEVIQKYDVKNIKEEEVLCKANELMLRGRIS